MRYRTGCTLFESVQTAALWRITMESLFGHGLDCQARTCLDSHDTTIKPLRLQDRWLWSALRMLWFPALHILTVNMLPVHMLPVRMLPVNMLPVHMLPMHMLLVHML